MLQTARTIARALGKMEEMEEMAEITALQVVYSEAVLHRRECPVFWVVV